MNMPTRPMGSTISVRSCCISAAAFRSISISRPRRTSWRGFPIGKPRHDVLRGRLIEIDRNAAALMQHDRTEIVDPMGLVGMFMGQEHCVYMIDIGVDQLLAQIGRGIDHNPRDAFTAGSF